MTISGFAYHERVSYDRGNMAGHRLDWEHQPLVYKGYPGIEPILLPQEVHLPDVRLSRLLKKPDAVSPSPRMDMKLLSCIFLLTYSLTARARHSGGDFYYRSAASAGALYPAEIYVAAQEVARLPDGLYHFSIARHGLSMLRPGQVPRVSRMAPGDPDTPYPGLRFFITAIFYRSAWKYRERSYRYHLLDAGHVAENLILALTALGLPCFLSLDVADDAVNRLLGVNPTKEVCLAVCRSSETVPDDETPGDMEDLGESLRDASRVADREVDYPVLRDIHMAGISVEKPPQAHTPMWSLIGPDPQKWRPIHRGRDWPETLDYAGAVMGRRSRRNFAADPIPEACLGALLEGLCAGRHNHPDEGDAPVHPSIAVGFLIGRAEAWTPGFYLLDPAAVSWSLIQTGAFLDRMAHISLDQMWLAHAGVHVVFLSNLSVVDRIYGPRGYRYAMIMAGRLGQRLYLMAAAMGLGCCGIGAFYDAEAAHLLGLNHDSRLLYLTAVGRTVSGRKV